MDKKEFLWELEKSLSVLQEDELRDIISEYEQHIDIKVEKGLTEEEAIADFGSLQELTAEILEAYHVRADYAAGTGRIRKQAGKNRGRERAENFEKLREVKEKGSLNLQDGMKHVRTWMINGFKWGWRQVRRPFSWIHSFMAAHNLWHGGTGGKQTEMQLPVTEDMPEQGIVTKGENESGRNSIAGTEYARKRREDGKMTGKSIVRDGGGIAGAGVKAIGRGVRRIVQWGLEAALWAIRLVWNGWWIMFSVFTGGFGLFSLFGLGLLTVLMIEGYPLVGVMIGCVGVVFCMFSAAGLGLTLLWRKTAEEAITDDKKEEKVSKHKPESSRRRIYKPGHTAEAGEKKTIQKEDEYREQQRKGDVQDA